jgi:hypothetical protein
MICSQSRGSGSEVSERLCWCFSSQAGVFRRSSEMPARRAEQQREIKSVRSRPPERGCLSLAACIGVPRLRTRSIRRSRRVRLVAVSAPTDLAGERRPGATRRSRRTQSTTDVARDRVPHGQPERRPRSRPRRGSGRSRDPRLSPARAAIRRLEPTGRGLRAGGLRRPARRETRRGPLIDGTGEGHSSRDPNCLVCGPALRVLGRPLNAHAVALA